MRMLDEIVLSALEQKLLTPDHLKALFSGLAKRIADQQGQSQEREKDLRREQRQVETAISRLYEAVEKGLVADEDLFRRRMSRQSAAA